MHFFGAPLTSLGLATLVAHAQALYLANELSFGHNGKISPNLRDVPNFQIIGTPNPPEILSNKVVLTPPAPGNQRGAVWSENPLLHSQWTVDVDFRATGPERGGGNLQIWYAKDGRDAVGTSSIFTAGKFDGLALVVDQYAGSGGYVRGFLNDGSTEYKSHHSVDSLAFGHCKYAFRNLGRPSRMTIKQTADKFSVEVDGNQCFDSAKIKLPVGYYFGVSAASAENPDSFEIFKFVVTTESHSPDEYNSNENNQQSVIAARSNFEQTETSSSSNDPAEVPASSITSPDAQFADLHNRLQAMMQHVTALNRDVVSYMKNVDLKNERLSEQITALSQSLSKLERISGMDKKLDTISNDVKQTKSELHNSLEKHVEGLTERVRLSHRRLMGIAGDNGGDIAVYLFVVVASQLVSFGAYLLYKKRKANMPKKYL